MRISRKGAGAIALGLGVAMAAGACASGAGAADVVTPEAPVVDGGVVEEVIDSIIGAAQRVGAMEDFSYGDTFRATQPITLDLMYRVHDGYPVQDDWLIWTALAENQNVSFNRTDVLIADWGERRNLLIGAGDFPTIVPNVWPGSQASWEAGGALLAVSDYFDYLPHFMHYLQEWDLVDQLEQHRNEDGNIYLLPILRELPAVEHTFMINVDLFEAAGAPTEFATFDDLADALRMVQAHGDVEYAYSERWNEQEAGPLGAALGFVSPNFRATAGWGIQLNDGLSTTRWDETIGEFVAFPLEDGYRDMVAFFAGLMADGVMDPEITQDDDTALQKFINGRSAMVTTNFSQMEVARGDARELGIELNTKMIAVPMGHVHQINASGGGFGPGFVLNANIADSPYFL
ncbi:MAG: extracellular solute-binding protein, partial [Promicromonosporaceae bacterium]|nr:extracellular solute-binding protein [Promicromonosporaceae bacterium]